MIGYKTINGLQLGPMQYPDTRYIPVSKLENGLVKSKVSHTWNLPVYLFFVPLGHLVALSSQPLKPKACRSDRS